MTHESFELLSRYLKIDTTNPPGNERKAAEFFAGIFKQEGIEYQILDTDNNRACIYARIKGKGEKGPLILLNHMDVVPADKEQWSFDPFGGKIKDGFIHGRGAIDMKGQGIMELLAFLDVKKMNENPNRDIIFLAVADEEEGGVYGAEQVLKKYPKKFKAGLVLNEGGYGLYDLMPDRPVFFISTAEKASNWITITSKGQPGHGSIPQGKNALERLITGLNRLQDMENPTIVTDVVAEYFKKLAAGWEFLDPYVKDGKKETLIHCLETAGLMEIPHIFVMLHNSISTNVILSGDKINVMPASAQAKIDVRLLPGQDPDQFMANLKKQLNDDDLCIDFICKDKAISSALYTNDYCKIETIFKQHFPNALIAPSLLFASSDSKFFRDKGITTYGVFPALLSMADINMVHGIDEKISQENMVLGSNLYIEIVKTLCGL